MSLKIKFGQFDPNAKADSSPSASGVTYFSRPAELARDGIMPGNFATGEWNYYPLDGTMGWWPDNESQYEWGIFSEEMTGDDGLFKSPPILDIKFTQNHKSNGLTLYFYPYTDDYAKLVQVTWYDANDVMLSSGVFELHSNIGSVERGVDGYQRVRIEFLSTNKPFRYVKLYAIDYGVIRTFDSKTDIDTAKVYEEIDPISNELTVNTFNFSVRTDNLVFTLTSDKVEDNTLMQRQMFTVYDDVRPYGVYFLQTWSDPKNTEKTFEFEAQDAVGVMEGYKFYGDMYKNQNASALIQELFEICYPTGLVTVKIDDALKNKTISGHIPITNCREALHMIAFAIGATVDATRRSYVWIYPIDTDTTFRIGQDEVYIDGNSLESREYYSAVNLTYYNYEPEWEDSEAFVWPLEAGDHIVEFSDPYSTLKSTNCTILEKHANHAIIRVPSATTVRIIGEMYKEYARTYSLAEEVSPGETENAKVYAENKLINGENAPEIAQRIFDYLKLRVQVTAPLLLEDREVGYVAETETKRLPLRGPIESLDINLVTGRTTMVQVGEVVADGDN